MGKITKNLKVDSGATNENVSSLDLKMKKLRKIEKRKLIKLRWKQKVSEESTGKISEALDMKIQKKRESNKQKKIQKKQKIMEKIQSGNAPGIGIIDETERVKNEVKKLKKIEKKKRQKLLKQSKSENELKNDVSKVKKVENGKPKKIKKKQKNVEVPDKKELHAIKDSKKKSNVVSDTMLISRSEKKYRQKLNNRQKNVKKSQNENIEVSDTTELNNVEEVKIEKDGISDTKILKKGEKKNKKLHKNQKIDEESKSSNDPEVPSNQSSKTKKLEKKKLKRLQKKQNNIKQKILQNGDNLKDLIKEEIKTEIAGEDSKPVAIAVNADPNKTKTIKRNARIIVRNMSFKATDESLKEHFSKYGEIVEVKILRKLGGKLVGCAFVQYENVPMAKKAILETNLKQFLGRPISVDWAVPKDKYMKHIVEKIDDETSSIQIKKEIKTENGDIDESGLSAAEIKIKTEPSNTDESKHNGDNSSESEGSSDEEQSDDEDDSEDEANDFKTEKDVKVVMDENSILKQKSNDAEDGCTVFVTNVPFSMNNEQLVEFAKKTGPIKYAVVCMDSLTEHSRGTAFVKFESSDKATEFLNLSRDELSVDGQALQPRPALLREHLGENRMKKQPKDSRHLYLVKEGVVIAGTKAAVGVSASDMAKRLTLEQNKTQMLRNLNRFISCYRLAIQNLPPNYDDAKLRRLCMNSVSGKPTITESRVMRNLRLPVGTDKQHPSKGYGFVMFSRHDDALACLRKLNNNPDIFDKNNRPIVSFSIEDKGALNARKKRLEKSQLKNPLSKLYQKPTGDKTDKEKNLRQNRMGKNNKNDSRKPHNAINRKRPLETKPTEQQNGDAQPKKKKKFNKKPKNPELHGGDDTPKPFLKKAVPNSLDEYSGLTSKPGGQHKMRSNFKLRKQAEIHKQNVKAEKNKNKKSLKSNLFKKEKIKQPKQKPVKQATSAHKDDRNFSDLVNKYKSKLVSNKSEKVKSKWYDS